MTEIFIVVHLAKRNADPEMDGRKVAYDLQKRRIITE